MACVTSHNTSARLALSNDHYRTEVKRFDVPLFVLAAGFVLLLFNGGTRFVMGLTLGPMTDDLQWSRGTLSFITLVFLVVSSLALPFAGRLADRYDARLVLAVSTLVACLSVGMMGLIETPLQAVVLYGVVFGAATACTSVPAIGVMISRSFPDRMGLANGVAVSGSGIGQLLIVLALTARIEDWGWRGSFVALGIAGAILVLPMTFFAVAPRDHGAAQRSTVTGQLTATDALPLRSIVRSRPFWLLVAIYGICGFQDHFVALHVVEFVRDHGVGSLLARNLFAFMGLFGVAGVVGSGYLSDRLGPIMPTAICFALRSAIFAMVVVSNEPIAIAAFALLYGLTFWMTAPLSAVYTREHFGTAHLGTINGIIAMVHNGFGGLGAYAGGVVFDSYGNYQPMLQLLLGMAILALLLTPGIRAPRT